MPGNIVKGKLLEAFDDFINASPTNLDDALNAYQAHGATAASILQFGVDMGILSNPSKDLKHIKKDWLPEADAPSPAPEPWAPQGLWPRFFPMGEILCQGLVNALRL